MDEADNDKEKISVIKQEILVSKLHNMQWLKNTSYSPNLGMTRAISKQKQEHQRQETNKVEDKISSMVAIETNSVEESNKCHLTMDTRIKDTSEDAMSEDNGNMWNKDLAAANIIPNVHESVTQQVEEEEELLNIAVVESIVTAKLEAQCRKDKEQNYQAHISPIDAGKNTEDACSNIPNSQKTDHNTKELNLIKHSDDNNNKTTILCASNVQKTTHDKESDKVSTEGKDKDMCTKKVTNTLKTTIKNGSNTILSKDNDKTSIPTVNSKKPVSNLSKSQTSINKQSRSDRRNSRYAFKNDCSKAQESEKQNNVSMNGIENTTKNTTAKSNLTKTDLETDFNKATDTTNQSVRKMQNSSNNISSNKDKTLQKQRTVPKQIVSKGQEPFKRSAPTFNRIIDKNKILEKTDKVTQVSKHSDLSLSESAKKNEKIVAEKDVQSDQKVNRGVSLRKSTTFVAQYKSSTYSKPVQIKSVSEDAKHPSIYGRSSTYIRNNSTSDKEHRTGNVENKDVTKMKREYTPTNTCTKSNIKTEEVPANNSGNPIKKQNKINYVKSRNVNSISTHEVDALTVTNKDSLDPVKTETHLVENKEFASLNTDHVEQESIILEQCCENREVFDNFEINVNEQRTEVDKQETDSPKYSPNLSSNNCIVRPQAIAINPHLLKLEDTQQIDDVNQLGNNQTTWSNDSSDNAVQKSATFMNTQQSIQYTYLQQNVTQPGNQMRQMLPLEVDDDEKFYDQRLAVRDTMQLPPIPNTFDTMSYECNVQGTTSDNDVTLTPNTHNRETLNAHLRYTPNMQQRPVPVFPEFHPVSNQTSRWSPPSMQSSFHVEQQFVNTAQPPAMHVYGSGAFGPDDFNNAHERNCLPPQQIFYAPCMQTTWNPQLQYPMPVYHNSPCTSYAMFPNVANQSNNFSDINVDAMCMHDQQHKYVHYVPMNNNLANTGPIQMHANPNYKGTHGCDPSNCAVETRNVVDNTPMKFNRYYKKHQDNYRVYDVPQYVTPVSHPRPHQPFVPARGANYNNQYSSNVYYPQSQKYYKQNGINYMQISRSPKDQNGQNFVCEDNDLEDIPPIISPKEFVTNLDLPNKTDQFATRVFKPDYKMKSNTGYRQPPLPRYNGGFRRNINNYQNFPKEQHTLSIGRGLAKKE